MLPVGFMLPDIGTTLDMDHGISPTRETFGANQYSVDGYTDPLAAHTHYWDPTRRV